MNTSSYRHKAKEILKGRYGEGFFVVSVCIVAYLIFKAFDIQVRVLFYTIIMQMFPDFSEAEALLKYY